MRPLLAGAGRDPSRYASLQPLHRRGRRAGAGMTVSAKGLQPRELGLIAAALALVADQGSKLFMLYGAGFAQMPPGETVPVLPFFNLVMVWNPGISYGLFPATGLGTVLLIALSVVAGGAFGWLLLRSTSRALAIGYRLVISRAGGDQ